ncbi:hypothetical protein [Arenibaculum sp.]|jgi:hypothetical protein|uniref:hypothetical protein n=1 Tax=Arenibaculum sp. TaxID=2865862 RepID=UPI002E112102|nr:hypothetical protein [Arenibaculum sp.]
MDHTWTRREPPVEELLSDPIAVALMRRDRVDPAWLASMLAEMRRKLGRVEVERAEVDRAA